MRQQRMVKEMLAAQARQKARDQESGGDEDEDEARPYGYAEQSEEEVASRSALRRHRAGDGCQCLFLFSGCDCARRWSACVGRCLISCACNNV
jgi:hypothetical protein